jgi:signal transduction histidine kinase
MNLWRRSSGRDRAPNDWRRTEEELAEARAIARRREVALGHVSDAVVVVLRDGSVEYANPAAKELLADRVLEVARRLNNAELIRLVGTAIETCVVTTGDVTLWVPAARPTRARAIPLGDDAAILILSDLSESYRLDRVRRDFVANVSHELKTPVAAIRALAETAATAMSSDDLAAAVRFIERLGTESTRLADLVSDLLDLSRVEAGELHRSVVDIDPVLAEAADGGRVIGEEKEIEIVVHDSHIALEADRSQLAMAVKNLVDNAVRYSEAGKIELEAHAGDRWVEIRVADQGVGIPSDELDRIFERFYRIDKGRSRATGGTGLGLAIVRHVAENHGGRVTVESELGVGSTFTISLPS